MFVDWRNASRSLRFVGGLLFLLLPPQTAGAQTAGADKLQLCNDVRADPDARIPACTWLLDHPSEAINRAEVYNHRGAAKVLKVDRGDAINLLDDAIADFTRALDEDPTFVDAFKNRGLARMMQGNYDSAIGDFSQAIRLNRRSPDLYNLRGLAQLDKQEYSLAIADFGKAIALDSNYVEAYVNRGLALDYTVQLDRAIADFNMVVHLAPNDPRGYTNRAMARMDKADFKGAVADYDQAISLDPQNSGPYTRRGEAWRLQGKFQQSQGKFQQSQGKFQQSLEDHNKAIELNPNDKVAYYNRAFTFTDQGKLDEAIADCGQAILLDPKYDGAYAIRGMIRRLKKDLWGSLTDLNKAVELNPSSPVALTFRGDTLRESDNYNGAMADFKQAIRIVPDNVAAYTGRGLTYEKLGDLAEAKADYQKALKLSPDVDAGFARPAQDVARTRLAAIANPANPSDTTETLQPKPIPDDIRQALDHRGHALLIGVSAYNAVWSQLPNVKNDLQDLKAGLDPYFETVEIEQNPTVSKLRQRISDFLLDQWNNPNERLFIYYSGHGFTAFNETSRDSDGYITGSDTPGVAVAKAVSFFEVDSWSRQTKARHVLMVFDSCFSGSLFKTMGPEQEPSPNGLDNVRTLLRRPMRYYITAGRQNEEVAADSTFAKLLLRGLRGEADFFHEGIISAEELGNYLFHKVPDYSPRPQTPQYKSIGNATLSEGQFFFLTGPGPSTDMTPVSTTPDGPGKSNAKSRTK